MFVDEPRTINIIILICAEISFEMLLLITVIGSHLQKNEPFLQTERKSNYWYWNGHNVKRRVIIDDTKCLSKWLSELSLDSSSFFDNLLRSRKTRYIWNFQNFSLPFQANTQHELVRVEKGSPPERKCKNVFRHSQHWTFAFLEGSTFRSFTRVKFTKSWKRLLLHHYCHSRTFNEVSVLLYYINIWKQKTLFH